MPSLTGQEVIGDAFALLNVFLPGEAIPANDGQFARRFLNDLLSAWGTKALMIPVVARERFDLVADQGGPDDPYTIGPGGDFDTERPSTQASLVGANLILTATDPEVRVPLGIYTDDAYDANAIPDLANSQPTALYYNPTYQNDLGSICLWPVPDVSTNDLELFLQKPLAQFADLSTAYFVPDGVPLALKYNLADLLQVPYGRELSAKAQRIAVSSLSSVKRSNTKRSDLPNDATWAQAQGTLYNIQTGS